MDYIKDSTETVIKNVFRRPYVSEYGTIIGNPIINPRKYADPINPIIQPGAHNKSNWFYQLSM